jgi:hypothetical protein
VGVGSGLHSGKVSGSFTNHITALFPNTHSRHQLFHIGLEPCAADCILAGASSCVCLLHWHSMMHTCAHTGICRTWIDSLSSHTHVCTLYIALLAFTAVQGTDAKCMYICADLYSLHAGSYLIMLTLLLSALCYTAICACAFHTVYANSHRSICVFACACSVLLACGGRPQTASCAACWTWSNTCTTRELVPAFYELRMYCVPHVVWLL